MSRFSGVRKKGKVGKGSWEGHMGQIVRLVPAWANLEKGRG